MMGRLVSGLAAVLLASAAGAEDFSSNSQAESWSLYSESPARFEAKVVDFLCEVAGDCADPCGGQRQLGLLRSADKALIFPMKNNQPLFTGAATELQPFCGKMVEVDGLMLSDPDIGANNVFQLQLIREVGATDWVKAKTWTDVWAKANPDLPPSDEPWFRRDPRVAAQIARNGWFGLGLEMDAAILKELYP